MGKLTAMKVRKAAPGVHSDGLGLLLRVKESGARHWVLRVQHDGRRQDIGLGSDADLSLAEAREKAAALRKIARQGGDARAARNAVPAAPVIVPSFAEAIEHVHAELGKGWSDKTATAFKASLKQHAVPVLGARPVDTIEAAHVIAVLAPIWTSTPQQARKVRHRIMQVLAFAKSHGWRTAPVPPADEIGRGLARQPRSTGFAAMPFAEVPALVAGELAKAPTASRLALLFTILTAARSGEVRAARWEQIDRQRRTWSRPAEMMKAGQAHTVMLSDAALALLDRARPLSRGEGLLFPSIQRGRQLSDMSLGKALRAAGRAETVHGFRSTFRDWAAEEMPTMPAVVAEMALAHSIGSATVEAYLRSDMRELRLQMMQAWGAFVAPGLGGSCNG